jgi:hypothetical protein
VAHDCDAADSFGGSEGAAPIVSCVPGPDASPGASLLTFPPEKRDCDIRQLGAGQQQVGDIGARDLQKEKGV